MDFKVSGTRNGITAIQLDIKPAGIPLDIICESLEPALKGRLQILDHMEREINAPRTQGGRNSPRLATLKYSNDALRNLIGPLGVLKRKIEEETGARMSVSDGTLTIVAKNQSVMEKVQEKVDFIVGREIEIGGTYKGVVSSIKEYGAFVEFNGAQQGLLHISELSHEPVARVSDVLSIGQQVSLMCIGQDVRGNIKLSLKATLAQPGIETSNVAVGSGASTVEQPKVWAPVNDVRNQQEKQISVVEDSPVDNNKSSDVSSSSSSSPSTILILSAAECDEEEKSAVLNVNSKSSSKTSSTSKSVDKSKSFSSQNNELNFPFFDSGLLSSRNTKKSKHVPSKGSKNNFSFNFVRENEDTTFKVVPSDTKATVEAPISTQKLKLGMKVSAKVHQIRAHGLVLDLGGGNRGMYRFETGRRDFEVGEEVQVKCCSFSSKGIPVMSMVEND